MYDSLIAKVTAATLAGFVSLAMLAGVNTLAVHEHAATDMAQVQDGQQQFVAASAPAADQI